MKLNKSMLAMGIVTTVAIGSLVGLSGAGAQSTDGSNSSPMSSLIDKITTKFNLNRDEVQAVFDANKTERKAKMEAKQEERLQTLVDDGKLTSEQKDALIAKRAEQKTAFDELKAQNLSREEMKAKMDEKKVEFETWASDQGIDLSLIRHKGEFRGPGGHHDDHGPMDGPEETDTTN